MQHPDGLSYCNVACCLPFADGLVTKFSVIRCCTDPMVGHELQLRLTDAFSTSDVLT